MARSFSRSVDRATVSAAFVLATLGVVAHVRADTRVLVSATVDGDTIRVDSRGRTMVVRLIGIDTPELHDRNDPAAPPQPFAREAAEFTRRGLKGQSVRLEFEPATRLDRFGRTLAYVFLDDGTLFNRALVQQGYARAYTRDAVRYREQLRADESLARRERRGLWAEPAAAPSGPVIGNRRSGIYHLPGQAHYNDVAKRNRVYFPDEDAARAAGFERALR